MKEMQNILIFPAHKLLGQPTNANRLISRTAKCTSKTTSIHPASFLSFHALLPPDTVSK